MFRNRKALQTWPALKHYLDATEDLIELILAKLRIRLTEIRPGVDIIDHQLEIVAVDVVVEAAE